MPIGGTIIPTLQNEKDVILATGNSWSASIEPTYPTDSGYVYSASGSDLHGDTEGDDLATYLQMYLRTGQAGYLSRATAHVNYLKSATFLTSLQAERDGWGGDHIYGFGLLDWYERSVELGSPDTAALDRAKKVVEAIAHLNGPNSTFAAIINHVGLAYGMRHAGRHVHALTRYIQVAGDQPLANDNGSGTIQAQTLLNTVVDRILASTRWDAAYGMYFADGGSGSTTDASNVGGTGAYALGIRVQGVFQIGVFCEGLYRYYRIHKDDTDPTMIARVAEIKSRLIQIGQWVNTYGLDSTYNYPSSFIGVFTQSVTYLGIPRTAGDQFQSFHKTATVNTWDTNYTISLVGPLVIAYKLSGQSHLLSKALYCFQRHNGARYDLDPVGAFNPENRYPLWHHFTDTIANNALTPNVFNSEYLEYNKGEYQYAYWLFENGGAPTVEGATGTVEDPTPRRRFVFLP